MFQSKTYCQIFASIWVMEPLARFQKIPMITVPRGTGWASSLDGEDGILELVFKNRKGGE